MAEDRAFFRWCGSSTRPRWKLFAIGWRDEGRAMDR